MEDARHVCPAMQYWGKCKGAKNRSEQGRFAWFARTGHGLTRWVLVYLNQPCDSLTVILHVCAGGLIHWALFTISSLK